jgi:hypothetical protein
MTESIASLLVNSERYSLTATSGEQLHSTFVDKCSVLLQNFYQGSALEFLKREVERLAKKMVRRDFIMAETENTERHMSTLNGKIIEEYSSLIPSIYNDPYLHQFLSGIAGELIYTLDDPGENYVLNMLHKKDDTHGAHIDTYAYAWITVIDAPSEGDGGCLELVPRGSTKKELSGPNVIRLWPKSGDCVFLKTDDTIHHVAPLTNPSARRLVIASVFTNEATRNLVSYSSKNLYGVEPE